MESSHPANVYRFSAQPTQFENNSAATLTFCL